MVKGERRMAKGILLLSLLAVAVSATAKPAYRGPIVRTDANGVEKTVFLHGDAWDHYMTDEQGTRLDEKTLLPANGEGRTANGMRKAPKRAKKIGNEPNPAPRGLLIMVNFTDQAFTTPRDTIDSMLNAEHFTRKYTIPLGGRFTYTVKSEGSARKYFQDQSYGQYNPVFDVMGPFTLAHDVAYYGDNGDANVGEMIKEACELANQNGADFTLYDNNDDGDVDFVYVLYAGYGAADGGPDETIWPHNYNLSYYGIQCRVDGKWIGNYACSNEISGVTNQYDGIGTICHEFSHVLGLPDMYETNNPRNGNHTLMEWDVLDYGCYSNYGNTPSAYSAYERFYMGWLTPRVLNEPEYVNLHPLQEGEALLISTNANNTHNLDGANPNPADFYLLENRPKTGWDAYLPGKGMLITKVSYFARDWLYNQVNNDSTLFGVDILEAKRNTGELGAATDAYPAGANQWTDFADHEVTNITLDKEGIIHFSYRGAEAPGTEDVETVTGEGLQVTGQKILRNGQIYILRNGKTYTILGYENHQL